MSGYEKNTQVSSLGKGVPGKFEAGFGNTMVGGDVALKRKKLRKAFKTNKHKRLSLSTENEHVVIFLLHLFGFLNHFLASFGTADAFNLQSVETRE